MRTFRNWHPSASFPKVASQLQKSVVAFRGVTPTEQDDRASARTSAPNPKKAMTIFKEHDGFTTRDLLQYGVDHLESGRILFTQGPHCYDSAGYLVQLGLELLLKAWHLYQFKQFDKTHRLDCLYKALQPHIDGAPLSGDQVSFLRDMDTFYQLRYPRSHDPVETGTDQWAQVDALLNAIWAQMPQPLLDELYNIDPTHKGGRILMKKKLIEHN